MTENYGPFFSRVMSNTGCFLEKSRCSSLAVIVSGTCLLWS
mgnify:CR=1 FL=1